MCGGYGRRCGQTEAATEQPIAAPAWSSYGTRPPLRNLCDLRTVRAAGGGFRGRHRALFAGRGVLGRFFGLREAARPRTWRYAIANCMRDKVHITRLKARSWGGSKCAIRHLGPTMTASEVVPFTLEFLFFCAGNFILAQNSCWGPRIFPPLSLLVIHTLSLAQCPELIVVSHRQGKPRRETSNPT